MAPRECRTVGYQRVQHLTDVFPPYSPELKPKNTFGEKGRSEVTHNRLIPEIEPVGNGTYQLPKYDDIPKLLAGFHGASENIISKVLKPSTPTVQHHN